MMYEGMFDVAAQNRQIPYIWTLPHFYLLKTEDSTQHPRNNLVGLVTPTGPRYRDMITIEPESGRIMQSSRKGQMSVKLFKDERNYFFRSHQSVIIPLYWWHETRNVTDSEMGLYAGFQSSFAGLHAGFIACIVLGAVSLVAALF